MARTNSLVTEPPSHWTLGPALRARKRIINYWLKRNINREPSFQNTGIVAVAGAVFALDQERFPVSSITLAPLQRKYARASAADATNSQEPDSRWPMRIWRAVGPAASFRGSQRQMRGQRMIGPDQGCTAEGSRLRLPITAPYDGGGLILPRPDQHAAGRGERPPADSLALIDRVRGAASQGGEAGSGRAIP